jgi:2-dehydro-3-deoxygluconokinase
MSTVVTFGEIMLRLTTPGHQRFAQATHFEVTPGGAEANVAVLIARLGGSAEFVTRLPAHDLGDRAVDELRRHGVGISHIVRGGDRVGLYFLEQGASQRPGKVIYDRANSALAEARPRDFDWDAIFAGKQWFHWSGITPALSRSAARISDEACKAARRHGLTISFDMNYRAKLWTMKAAGTALRPLMKQVDLCVAGAGEARAILGAKGATDELIAADLAKRFGFKTVALTSPRGDTASATDWGANAVTKGEVVHSPRQQIMIVDRVGSGDAFTGALHLFPAPRRRPANRPKLRRRTSALKHTIPGDYALVTLAEVEALAAGEQGGRVQR